MKNRFIGTRSDYHFGERLEYMYKKQIGCISPFGFVFELVFARGWRVSYHRLESLNIVLIFVFARQMIC